MKIYVHKETNSLQTFPEPKDLSNWYVTEAESIDAVAGKVYDPEIDSFVPDIEEKARAAREERDQKLSSSDWLVLRSQETGEPVPTQWREYRQALRDLPEQSGFPFDIDWPEEPH